MIYPDMVTSVKYTERCKKDLREKPCENDDGYIIYIKSMINHGKTVDTLASNDKFHLMQFTDAHTFLITNNLRLKFTEEEESYIQAAIQRSLNMVKAFNILNHPSDGPMYFEELKEVQQQVVYRIQKVIENPYEHIPLEVQKSISDESLFTTEDVHDFNYFVTTGDKEL